MSVFGRQKLADQTNTPTQNQGQLFHVPSQATAEVGSMQIKLRKGLKMIRQLMADMANLSGFKRDPPWTPNQALLHALNVSEAQDSRFRQGRVCLSGWQAISMMK